MTQQDQQQDLRPNPRPNLLPLRSILPMEMRGVMFIAGHRGVGKSFLSSQADFPQNMEMWDFENKGEGIHAQVNFKRYLPMTQNVQGVTFYAMQQAIEGITPGTTVVILDNISELEKALRVEAKANAKKYADKYGLNADNIASGRFGGASSVVNPMISELCAAIHAKGVQLIIATAHVSSRWATGGPIPNKYNIKGADRWQELSILSLVLYKGDPPRVEVPNALIQKEQLGVLQIVDPASLTDEQLAAYMRGEVGHAVSRRLPFKIANCDFQRLRWYLKNPADIHNPKPNEMPTLEESDPFDSRLNKEQFSLVAHMARAEAMAEEQAQQEQAQMAALQATNILADVRTILMTNTNASPPQVVAELRAKGINVEIPAVAAAILQVKAELPL